MLNNRDLISRLDSLKSKAETTAEAKREAAKNRAEENRRRMPVVASVVDEYKAVFGDDQVTVTYAKENGIEMGKKGPEGIKLSETGISGSFVKKGKR